MTGSATLGEIAEFINGYAFNERTWEETGTPIVRIQNLTNSSKPFNYTKHDPGSKFHIEAGDILVSWSATLDVFEWTGPKAYVNQHIFKVVPNRAVVDKSYLIHALRKAIKSMAALTRGSTMKHINRGDFLGTEVSLPPIDEQQRIAAILDRADSLYRKRQQALRLAERFLQSTFIDMFGDLNSNPKRFEVGTIRDLVASANYGTSEKAREDHGKYPILRMNNITYEGGWNFSSLKYVDLDPANAHKYIAQKGDLLFNRTNSKELVGKTAVYMRDEPMAIAGYLVRVRMNKRGNPHYVSGYLNSTHGKQTLEARAKSIVGMANINAQEMQDIPLLLPPIELQDKYAQIFEAVHAHLQMHQTFLDEAMALCASLSYKFFGPINSEKE